MESLPPHNQTTAIRKQPGEPQSYTHVRLHPWVGPNYADGGGIFRQPTLILGDSHYSDEHESFENDATRAEWEPFTSEIISYYLDPSIRGYWKKTYSTFINCVFGHLNLLH